MNDRAVSTTVSYVLALSIATMLVGGLIVAGSTFVEDRRESVVEQEMRVVGEHLASNVEQVDRYARAPADVHEARISQTYPGSVTDSSYTVRLRQRDPEPSRLLLNASNPDVRVAVNVTVQSDVDDTAVGGGRIAAVYDTDDSHLEIEND